MDPFERHAATAVELRARLQAERRGNAFLLYREGGGAQVIVELEPERRHITVGRREGADVVLGWDAEVSRLHAELERIGDDWVVRDEGLSHNGTWVNGERVHSRRRLRDGDVISVGRTVLAWRAPAGAAMSATRTGREAAVVELTPAQRRVLVELCRPLVGGRYDAPASNPQIADALCVAVDTVKGTLRQLFGLFGVDTVPQNQKRAALARRALETGAVHRDELSRCPPG